MPKEVKELMDSGGLTEYLGYTQRTIYKLIKEEGLPAAKIRGQFRFEKDIVDRWLEKRTQDIDSRLMERGLSADDVDYVRKLAKVGAPFWPKYFREHYGQKSVKEILLKIEDWQRALGGDFLIHQEIRLEIRKYIALARYAMCQAILDEVFPNEYLKIRFDVPSIYARILAIPRTPAKLVDGINYMEEFTTRVESILHDKLNNFRRKAKRIGKLYDKSRGTRQHGALFARVLIPILYEYLLPFYKTPNHWWQGHDEDREFAWYPEALMRDIRDILHTEYPDECTNLTPNMVKAAVSRYRKDRKSKDHIEAFLSHRLILPEDLEAVLKSLKNPEIA